MAAAHRSTPVLGRLHTAWAERWGTLAPREQRGVAVALLLVGACVVWWLVLAPALGTLRQAETQRRALDAQWDAMRALQARAQALQAQPVLSQTDALLALQSAVAGLGKGAQLQVLGDRATVTLQQLQADALSQWLAGSAAALRLQPAEVHWTRDGGTATWSGTLVFNLPAPSAGGR